MPRPLEQPASPTMPTTISTRLQRRQLLINIEPSERQVSANPSSDLGYQCLINTETQPVNGG